MGDYNDAFMRNDSNSPSVQARTKAQNRANVLQLKHIGQGHPTGLTNNLLKLFEPRPPLEYKSPPEKRKCPPYTGMAQFVSDFAEPGQPEYAPPVQKGETPTQRRARIHKLRLESGAATATEELQKYDPNNDPNTSGDPYKTLFVARLNYETSENRVKREFEAYGPIKRVRLITDKESNKPKGYAFIEYMHTRDMKAAYKQADGRKVDGRRVLVDVERGRTVPNWRPRRLGGGLGTTRVGGEDVNQSNSGREQQQSGPPRSEEPRIREDRHVDRDDEKSRERGRDRGREGEKSHERSLERPRERDHKDDRHHRDRERNRDRDRDRERERERDHGGRDRDRTRDRGRDRGRDYDRNRERDREREYDRPRREKEREREREKDYEVGELEHDRGRSHDRELDYDHVETKQGKMDQDYDHGEDTDRGWYEKPEYGLMHPNTEHDDRDPEYDHDRYDQMEGNYEYDRATSEPRERRKARDVEREQRRRSERSISHEHDY